MKFVSWDFRPAVLGDTEAKALLKPAPKADWVEVDFWDVWNNGGLMSEADWRERFTYQGFALDPLPMLDQTGPAKPRAPA